MNSIPTPLPDRLAEENLDIVMSDASKVPDAYVSQIIKNSRQPHVMKFEGHEDAEGRFKDAAAYKSWAAKDRLVYLLVGKPEGSEAAEIGGIIWFGKRSNSHLDRSYGLTFGIRLYEGSVGKGLAVPFMRATHEDLARFYPEQKIWLDFAEDNIAARKAYESFGYKYLMEADGRVMMGYHIGSYR